MALNVDRRSTRHAQHRDPMRFRLDSEATIDGNRIIGGSPPSMLRISAAGRQVLDAILSGNDLNSGQLLDRMLELGIVHPAIEPIPIRDGEGRAVVTVVTPTLGAPHHRQRHGLDDDHLILVDDGSNPPVQDATIRLDTNMGPAAARNRGLAAVNTEFCAFVDADVDTGDDDHWLRSLLGHFDDPHVAAVAPRVRSRAGRGALERHEQHHGALDMGDKPAPVRPGTRIAYVPAAALICRTSAIREIGGFDEAMRTGEDVDLIWRLVDAGHTVRYAPDVEVVHEPRSSWRAFLSQRIGYGASAALLEHRHPGRVAPLVISPWSAVALAALLIPRRPWYGIPTAVAAMVLAAMRLANRLPELGRGEALRIVSAGTTRAAVALAKAVRRTWWPVALVLLPLRPVRRLVLLSVLAARSPLVVVDDLAHGAGVWKGALRERSFAALAPRISHSRPERRTTSTYHSAS